MSQTLKIHHDLADVVVQPNSKVNGVRLKEMIRSALDLYLSEDWLSAEILHSEVRRRHGEHYQSPGYYLRLYRQRAALTQKELARRTGILQHHLSEMENNTRVLGKSNAVKLAKMLDCAYQRLL